MAYQVLARKWRPKTFAELTGQEHVVTALTRALESPRVVSWAFDHYLNIAPPSFVAEVLERVPRRPRTGAFRPSEALGT